MHDAALVRPAVFEYEPAGHGSSAAARNAQKLPPVHCLHDVDLDASWKVPSAQLLHVCCSGKSLYVPGAQSVATSLPTPQKVPLGQITHWLALLR